MAESSSNRHHKDTQRRTKTPQRHHKDVKTCKNKEEEKNVFSKVVCIMLGVKNGQYHAKCNCCLVCFFTIINWTVSFHIANSLTT